MSEIYYEGLFLVFEVWSKGKYGKKKLAIYTRDTHKLIGEMEYFKAYQQYLTLMISGAMLLAGYHRDILECHRRLNI